MIHTNLGMRIKNKRTCNDFPNTNQIKSYCRITNKELYTKCNLIHCKKKKSVA